jgi:hypothetical protein
MQEPGARRQNSGSRGKLEDRRQETGNKCRSQKTEARIQKENIGDRSQESGKN